MCFFKMLQRKANAENSGSSVEDEKLKMSRAFFSITNTKQEELINEGKLSFSCLYLDQTSYHLRHRDTWTNTYTYVQMGCTWILYTYDRQLATINMRVIR